ncbi:hypothetical protein C8Q77DRAFT_136608 [Trametes polyzona]|nr:hypothetical protein C8Q77DRAFT_136608 [Trametes polyzona]
MPAISRKDTEHFSGETSSKASSTTRSRRALSRSATELFDEAYKHFSTINGPATPSPAEPPLSQIVEELDQYKHAYGDDDELPAEEESGGRFATPSSSQQRRVGSSATQATSSIASRTESFSNMFSPRPSRIIGTSLSQILDEEWPNTSSLANAPPPDFSSLISPQDNKKAAKKAEKPAKKNEELAMPPMLLEDLIHIREDSPAPESLRRMSSQSVPVRPQRGHRTLSRVGSERRLPATEPLTGATDLRTRYRQDRGADSEEKKGLFSPYPSPSKPRRK